VALYALVTDESDLAVDVFLTADAAEEALAEILHDEPAFAPLLSVIAIAPPWQGCDRIILTASAQ
jgi:hypothetical protein